MNGPMNFDELRRRADEAQRVAAQAKAQAREARRQAHEAWRSARGSRPRAAFLWDLDAMRHWDGARRTGSLAPLVGSLILILVGGLLLLGQMGFLPFDHFWRLWPLVFVFVGLHNLAHIENGKWIGSVFMIAFGGLLIAHEFGGQPFGFLELWPMLLIGLGLELAWRIWRRPPETPVGGATPLFNVGSGVSNAPHLDSVNIFGGTEQRILSKEFTGGRLLACFGGYKIDLSQAEILGDAARLEATAIFGGGEIIVPRHWNIIMKGAGIFGGYSDETAHVPPPPGWPSKTLLVEGAAIFGGVEIKN